MTISILGKRIRIARRDLEKILEKFDARNAVKKGDKWYIFNECPPCKRYFDRSCKYCPFNKWGDVESAGCRVLLPLIVDNPATPFGDHLLLRYGYIRWLDHHDKIARLEIEKIRGIIKEYLEQYSKKGERRFGMAKEEELRDEYGY